MSRRGDLAEKVIREEKKPLSTKEIWAIAERQGYLEKLGLKGPTSWIGMQVMISGYINNNRDSKFIKTGTNPVRFYLKDLPPLPPSDVEQPSDPESYQKTKSYSERDLHPLLSYFMFEYKSIYTKTIFHEKSTKGRYSQWQHPDIVGVSYKMAKWTDEVWNIVNCTGNQPVKILSYELKIRLGLDNLRESFFQAVSNSSWANEGFLVTSEIDISDEEFMSEITRLSNSFGIGLILLNTNEPDNSEILLQARQKDILDIEMMDKIAGLNPDFRDFLTNIKADVGTKRIVGERFDKILEKDELIKKYNKDSQTN